MTYSRTRHNGGFLMILFLLVIVAGLIFYFQMAGGSRVSSEAPGGDGAAADSSFPWDFEGSIGSGLNNAINDAQFKPEKKQLSSAVRDKAGDQPRGRVSLLLDDDGTVAAGWSGTYKTSQNVEYEIVMASAEGNVDPGVVYVDLDGKEDRSLLYFITKGKFMFLRTEDGKITRPAGELFITGFIRPDATFFGNVHLTSDRTKQTVFDFGKEYQ